VSSPTTAQQQSGAGTHTGNSSGHPGTPASNTGTTAGIPSAPGGAQASSSTFSAAAAGVSQSTGSAQQATQNLSHGLASRSVSLQEAVDAVKATFTAANQAGVSSARISLSPESLGGIKISLSQTPDGLIARVATDHPEAAQTLQQSAAELKQSLEASGMSLLRLDIGTSGQQSFGNFAGSAGDGSRAGSSWTADQGNTAEDDTTSTPTELSIEPANGSLVNVLA
jgi:flagellar hook-length control protein FliK